MKSSHPHNWELPLEETHTDASRSFTSSCELVKESFRIIEQLYCSHVDHGASYSIPIESPVIGKAAVPMDLLRRSSVLHDMRVALFCSGITKIQVIFHLLATESRIPFHRINMGALVEEDWPRLTTAAARLSDAKIFIDDTKRMTISEMIVRSKAIKTKDGLDFIVINDLCFLSFSRRPPDAKAFGEVILALKHLAIELNIAVVAMSSLMRNIDGHSSVNCRDSNDHKEVDDQQIEEYTQFALLLNIWNGPIRKLILPIKRVT